MEKSVSKALHQQLYELVALKIRNALRQWEMSGVWSGLFPQRSASCKTQVQMFLLVGLEGHDVMFDMDYKKRQNNVCPVLQTLCITLFCALIGKHRY